MQLLLSCIIGRRYIQQQMPYARLVEGLVALAAPGGGSTHALVNSEVNLNMPHARRE